MGMELGGCITICLQGGIEHPIVHDLVKIINCNTQLNFNVVKEKKKKSKSVSLKKRREVNINY